MKRKTSRMRKWLRALTTHPLIVVPIIVAIGLVAWNRYLFTSHNYAIAVDNLMPDGNFAQYDSRGIPSGWQYADHCTMQVAMSHGPGYVLGDSFTMHISGYKDGDAALSSPTVTIDPGRKYLFKGFYRSSMPFDLLVRYTYNDGSTQLQLVRSYAASGSAWTTASDAFTSPSNVQTAQFVYRLSGNGSISFNNEYLENDQSLLIPAATKLHGANLIQNPTFSAVKNGIPQSWLVEKSGINQPKTDVVSSAADPYLTISVTNYKNGAASWLPQQIPGTPHQYLTFSTVYMSDVKVDVVIAYELSNHTYQFVTIATLNPASEWTTATVTFETPANTVAFTPSLTLDRNGTVSTRNYSLYDSTNGGTPTWKRPTVSLTFDGGWQSQFTNALPLLKQYGDKATFYVNVATLGTQNVADSSELQQLQQQKNEIASQGYNYLDLTTINSRGITAQLEGSQANLNKILTQKTTDFAAPYGNVDASVRLLLRSYYMSNRGTTSGINTKQTFDPYDLKVLYVGGNTPLSDVQKAISQAQAYNGWLILVYNQVPSSKSLKLGNTTSVSTAELQQQLDAIKHSGVQVKTIAQALDELVNE